MNAQNRSNTHGLIKLEFAGERRDFRLTIEDIIELETDLNASLFAISSALQARLAPLSWIRRTLYYGLIGGGMEPHRVKMHLDNQMRTLPIETNRDTAHAVALAGLARMPYDQLVAEAEAGSEAEAEPPVPSTGG